MQRRIKVLILLVQHTNMHAILHSVQKESHMHSLMIKKKSLQTIKVSWTPLDSVGHGVLTPPATPAHSPPGLTDADATNTLPFIPTDSVETNTPPIIPTETNTFPVIPTHSVETNTPPVIPTETNTPPVITTETNTDIKDNMTPGVTAKHVSGTPNRCMLLPDQNVETHKGTKRATKRKKGETLPMTDIANTRRYFLKVKVQDLPLHAEQRAKRKKTTETMKQQIAKSSKQDIDPSNCSVCHGLLQEGEEKYRVGCDYCNRWFHKQCVKAVEKYAVNKTFTLHLLSVLC